MLALENKKCGEFLGVFSEIRGTRWETCAFMADR